MRVIGNASVAAAAQLAAVRPAAATAGLGDGGVRRPPTPDRRHPGQRAGRR